MRTTPLERSQYIGPFDPELDMLGICDLYLSVLLLSSIISGGVDGEILLEESLPDQGKIYNLDEVHDV